MATLMDESAQNSNPQWEKARQALEKLQTPEQENKASGESNEKEAVPTPPPSNIPPHQGYPPYNMYGQFPPPYYGGMYPPRMPYGPVPPPYPPPGYFPVRPPYPSGKPSGDSAGKESGVSSNEKSFDKSSENISSPNSYSQGPIFNSGFRGGRFQRPPNSNLRFQLPKKNIGPSNAFQFGSGARPKRWPGPYGARDHRPQVPRHQGPFYSGEAFGKVDNKPKPSAVVNSDTLKQSNESQVQESSAEKAAAATGEWPPNLKRYVQRCFGCSNSADNKDEVERWLKEKLTEAFNKGNVGSIDWDSEPVPEFLNRPKSPLGRKDTRNVSDESSRYKRGSFPGRRNWSPPGFKSRRHRSRTRSHSRSRSRSPYSRKGRRRHLRNKSRSRSSSFSISSDEEDRVPGKENASSRTELSTRGRGRNGKRGRSRGRGRNNQTTPEVHNNSKKDKQKKNKGLFKMNNTAPEKLNKRAARFAETLGKSPRSEPLTLQINSFNGESDGSEMDWNDYQIVGTCQEIEKRYFRLTTAPAPSQVRPLEVLKKSLAMVKSDWKKNHHYKYACEQLKSIRQDLTVQCVRSEFTVEVYEVHARVALENGDREEFNQCQTQLKALYNELASHDGKSPGNCLEFAAYRILYNIFVNNPLGTTTELARLSKDMKKDSCIKFSLQICDSCSQNNYYRVFKLSQNAPKMCGYLVDWFAERLRKEALKCFIKSYRTTVSVDFIQTTLGYSVKTDCVEWLKEKGVVLSADDSKMDSKANAGVLPSL